MDSVSYLSIYIAATCLKNIYGLFSLYILLGYQRYDFCNALLGETFIDMSYTIFYITPEKGCERVYDGDDIFIKSVSNKYV
jgi:hypothetical protein